MSSEDPGWRQRVDVRALALFSQAEIYLDKYGSFNEEDFLVYCHIAGIWNREEMKRKILELQDDPQKRIRSLDSFTS